MNKYSHIPVMLNEVLEVLNLEENKTYVDCTFGNGGYTKAILESVKCKIIAFDRDPNAKEKAKEFKQKYKTRFTFYNTEFSKIDEFLEQESVDGIIFDLGVSSMQIDNPDRGFSYKYDAPLDMRMSSEGLSAFDVINKYTEREIADVIYQFGEERNSRKIAKAIVNFRKEKEIKTSYELIGIIKNNVRVKNINDVIKRTFQGIRIYINNELEELKTALYKTKNILKSNGKLIVVTFHSLEDRIVKNFIKEFSGKNIQHSKYLPDKESPEIIFKKSQLLKVSKQEADANSRSRSAKLRFAVKK